MPPVAATRESRALLSISIRERIESILRPYLDEFREALTDLSLVRRTYGGAWVIGVRTTGGPGDLGYSRLEFELEIDTKKNAVRVTAKSTTFNRDHAVQSLKVETAGDEDAEGWMRLEAFFERAFLLFAGRYWEAESAARWAFPKTPRSVD